LKLAVAGWLAGWLPCAAGRPRGGRPRASSGRGDGSNGDDGRACSYDVGRGLGPHPALAHTHMTAGDGSAATVSFAAAGGLVPDVPQAGRARRWRALPQVPARCGLLLWRAARDHGATPRYAVRLSPAPAPLGSCALFAHARTHGRAHTRHEGAARAAVANCAGAGSIALRRGKRRSASSNSCSGGCDRTAPPPRPLRSLCGTAQMTMQPGSSRRSTPGPASSCQPAVTSTGLGHPAPSPPRPLPRPSSSSSSNGGGGSSSSPPPATQRSPSRRTALRGPPPRWPHGGGAAPSSSSSSSSAAAAAAGTALTWSG
jgi:hypothetical protein